MQTIGLTEAAKLLRCNRNTVREKAASGEIPGAKIGRAWVFVEVDLLSWLRSQCRHDSQSGNHKQNKKCRSTKTKPASIGSFASRSTGNAYAEALELPTKQKPAASTTRLRLVYGNNRNPA